MTTGILSLQGAVDAHKRHLAKLGEPCISVRTIADLVFIDRLIIPGGESSTMLKLIKRQDLFDPLIAFAHEKPVWGVCAGAILLSKRVLNPEQDSLGVANVQATRNFYGSQLQSFSEKVFIERIGAEFECDFIRAPRLDPLSKEVEVLAMHEKQPVIMQHGRILLASFHIELNKSCELHRYFLEL